MKFVSFRVGGAAHYGLVDGTHVVDLTKRLNYPDLKAVIAAGALAEAGRAAKGASPDFKLSELTFDPVIPNPNKIICLGLNYEDHINETGLQKHNHPTTFIRYPDSQVGHLQPLIKTRLSEKFDYEGELAAIVGKGGRHISEADAMSHIVGYSCYNEGSVRDYQRYGSQFTAGKNFPDSGSFGPYMVTADEMGELKGKTIKTRLNGETMQDATLDQMIYGVPQLVAYISSWTPLSPGDVIVTGTPGGVGWVRKPPVWMKAGDIIEIEIQGIGVLKNTIADEA
jgi:2-keto-4-pentenoate hydratase/2-oxohepta-3-ene-1,7-dioic acid hydratase in catechol pathway